MALRAAGEQAAAVVSWLMASLYCLAAQSVALLSTLEIGPNLLAAITSIIGAGVLLGQAYIANKVKRVDHVERKVEENTKRLKSVEEKQDNDGG